MSYQYWSLAEKVSQILQIVPQQTPFRYIDDIIELKPNSIVGTYTFRPDEYFYEGHFPGNPITPGVILLECMAQIGLVALAIHLYYDAGRDPGERTTFFQSADVDFKLPVRPGEKVTVRSEKVLFKMGKIVCDVTMSREDGSIVAQGKLTGMGVRKA